MGGSNCALPLASGKLVVYSRKWQAQPVQQAGWHTLYWKTSRMPPLQCPRVPETLTPGRAVLRCSGGNGTTKICHCSTPPVDTTTLTVRSPSPTMNSYSPGRATTTLVAVEFLECSSIDQSLAQHGKVVNLSVPETNRNQRRAPQYTRASIRKKNRLNAYPCFFRLWRVVLEPIHSRNSFPSCRLVKRLSFLCPCSNWTDSSLRQHRRAWNIGSYQSSNSEVPLPRKPRGKCCRSLPDDRASLMKEMLLIDH